MNAAKPTVQSIKAHARRKIDKMTKEEATATLQEIVAHGIMDNPKLRELTGGYASQALQGYVQRYLGVPMGIIEKRNAR